MTARSDLGGGVGWMGFGLVILVASWRMERFETMGATVYTAPGFVPAIFGFALVLLGAVLARRGWSAQRVTGGAEGEPLLSRRIGLMLVLTLAYAAGMVGRAPFWLATTVFVTAFTAVFADSLPPVRRAFTALASGVLTSVAVLVVFERIFLVRLP
jgi:tetrahydromethanopterin S-methyltransferase subunit E